MTGLIQFGNTWYFPCQLPNPVDYCISTDYHLNCLLCTQGYYVKYNMTSFGFNECRSKNIGCAVYNDANKNCDSCIAGWTKNKTLNFWDVSENYCVFTPDPKCTSYAADGYTCQKCATGYSLSSTNACVIDVTIPNC